MVPRQRSTHTVFSTGCSPYFDWQALGLAYSHRDSGQAGQLTRLISECPSEADRARSSSLPLMSTHEHPDYGKASVNGVQDTYAPYNKAGGLLHWLAASVDTSSSDYLLLVESDMLLRQPIDCAAMGVRPGLAASSRYDYLRGASNGMARGFIKSVHRVQPVGGWACLHRDDARRLASRWYELTKAVRKNPQRYWHMPGDPDSVDEDLDTGDAYARRGHAPFISDMYGYIFAAAEVGLQHLIVDGLMIYAGHTPDAALPSPSILHYGLWCSIRAPGLVPYAFNKLSFTGGHRGGFDPHVCDNYFPAPPLPTDLIRAQLERSELSAAMLCAEVGTRLNAALCEYHHVPPPATPGAPPHRPTPCALEGRDRPEDAECPAPSVAQLLEAQSASGAIGSAGSCDDRDARCADWAAMGECDGDNRAVVRQLCAQSCAEPRCARRTLGHRDANDDRGGGKGDEGITAGGGSHSVRDEGHSSTGTSAEIARTLGAERDVVAAEAAGREHSPTSIEVQNSSHNDVNIVVGRRSMRHLLEDEARTASAWLGDAHADQADDLLAASSITASAIVPKVAKAVAGRDVKAAVSLPSHGPAPQADRPAEQEPLNAAKSAAPEEQPKSTPVSETDVSGRGHQHLGHPRQAGRMANARLNQARFKKDGEQIEDFGQAEPHGDNGQTDGAAATKPSLVQISDEHSYDAVDLTLLTVVLLALGIAGRFAHTAQHHLRKLLFGKARSL